MCDRSFSEFLLHHRFSIGPGSDVHFGREIFCEDDEMGTEAIDESAIMKVYGVLNIDKAALIQKEL
jgi:hypothetical protein